MSSLLRPVFAVLLLVGLLLSARSIWAQSNVESPPNQLFLPLVIGAGIEATQQSDPASDDRENVAVPTEYFNDESAIPLEATDLVQSSRVTVFSSSLIDATEDYRALGYPDGRKIVRSRDGKLYVAYRKKINNRYRIFVAQSDDNGSTWHVLNNNQPIENVGNYNQRVPALAIDNQDRLHLLWYGNDAGNTNATNDSNEREIKYTRSTLDVNGLTWEPWRNLYDGAGYTPREYWQEHPALYVDESNVYAVWESNEGALAHIKFQRSTDYGATWGNVIQVKPSLTVNFSRPTIVVSQVGAARYLYLFAYGTKDGFSQIYWSRSTNNGASWSAWQRVAATTTDQRHVSVARDRLERLHLVWRQILNGRTIIRYRVYDPAMNNNLGGWVAAPVTIASVAQRCLFFPGVAIGSNDQVWVVWTQSSDCSSLPKDDPKDGQLFARTKAANGAWSSPVALTTTGKHLYASLRRANDPTATTGPIDVVWLDISGSTLDEGGNVVCPSQACWLRQSSLGG